MADAMPAIAGEQQPTVSIEARDDPRACLICLDVRGELTPLERDHGGEPQYICADCADDYDDGFAAAGEAES